jgi:hypothetical protein
MHWIALATPLISLKITTAHISPYSRNHVGCSNEPTAEWSNSTQNLSMTAVSYQQSAEYETFVCSLWMYNFRPVHVDPCMWRVDHPRFRLFLELPYQYS